MSAGRGFRLRYVITSTEHRTPPRRLINFLCNLTSAKTAKIMQRPIETFPAFSSLLRTCSFFLPPNLARILRAIRCRVKLFGGSDILLYFTFWMSLCKGVWSNIRFKWFNCSVEWKLIESESGWNVGKSFPSVRRSIDNRGRYKIGIITNECPRL